MLKISSYILLFILSSCFCATNLNAQVIYEAEDAFYSSGKVDTQHSGYTGDGFVDTENESGAFIEWKVNSLKAYNDTLAFRYALGKDEHRTMQVYVNETLTDTIDFDNTVNFTSYIYKYTIGNLIAGENTIRLTAINIEGAPNIDHLSIKLDTNYYLKIDTLSIGNGTLNVLPIADSFLYGTRVKVQANPANGNNFDKWSGDFSGSNNPLAFTVDKDFTINAHFINLLRAFPGAEGFGSNTTGGRGGDVYEVTNLNDSGPGSLRDAIEKTGKRTIVFRVAGTIYLNSRLKINNDNITIAGQTAPGDGITLAGYTLNISANNVIVRYIRSRLGDVNKVEDDAMNGYKHQNIILDHCTMSWSVDEVASFYDNTNFTMQYCLLSESLYNSVHSKGAHGYGGIWGGKGATFHHNLLAHNTSRNPRFCGSRYSNQPDLEKVDFRNNVIFNWGGNSIYGAEGGNYNLVNNYYKYGPATSSSVKTRIIAPNADDGSNDQPAGVWGVFYVDGNYVNGYPGITEQNWAGVHASISDKDDIKSLTEFDCDSVTTHIAEIAFEHVIAQAGVCIPKRDILDERIIQEVISGKVTYGGDFGEGKGIIDTPSDVGGYPALESGTAPDDTDKDGMPDSWETNRGLNPNDPEDRNGDDNNNGYTNLEEYLNELVENNTYIIRPFNFAVKSFTDTEVVLEWEDVTDNETGFLLERRANSDNYEQIAQLAANTQTYTDKNATASLNTYRLRSYNKADTSLYTDTVSVGVAVSSLGNTHDKSNIFVYPNPFRDNITFRLSDGEKSEPVFVRIIDLTGRTVYNKLYPEANEEQITIELKKIPRGLYLFSIQTNRHTIVKKITKN